MSEYMEILKYILSFFSGAAISLVITFSITSNHYTKKYQNKTIFQTALSFIHRGDNNFGCNEEKVDEKISEAVKNRPSEIRSKEEPAEDEQEVGGSWIQEHD